MLVVLFVPCAAVAENQDNKVSPLVHQALESNESVPVWIFLADKNIDDVDAAIQNLNATYNPRAIQRRIKRRTAPGLFDVRDLPVADAYVAQIEQHVTRIRIRSRWLNAVSALIDANQLDYVAELSFVRSIQLVRKSTGTDPIAGRRVAQHQQSPGPGTFYGLSYDQLETINLPAVHQAGWTGQGIIIGILDTGFKRTHDAFSHVDNPLNVIAEYDFINDDPNTAPEAGDHEDQHRHGTLILGTLAAYEPETYVGAAYQASFILCKTEDITDEYQGEEDFYVAGLEFIESGGGDIATSSLSYRDWYTQADMDGETGVTTIGVNTATDNGVHCCTSVGNGGHDNNPSTSELGAPADAFKVFSVGSVNIFGEISGFSSDGPTADGRTKPEILAVGESTATVSPSNDSNYTTASGTSLSCPLVAGAIACILSSNDSIEIDTMRDAVLFTGSEYVANGTFDPLHVHGYGIMDANAALVSMTPTTEFADSFNIFRGILESGTLESTFDSDDSHLNFFPGLTLNSVEPPVWIEFSGDLASESPSSMSITMEASANTSGLTQTIEMFNWNTGQYELVDSQSASVNSDSVVEVDLTSESTNYVQSGTAAVKSRIGFKATGLIFLFPWTASIDQQVWNVIE